MRTEVTSAEGTAANLVNSFDPDGFTLGSNGTWNNSGSTNVAWCWDAGDNQPTTGISSVVYTGSGTSQKITGLGFQPDLVWIKRRNGANNHNLFDSVRGTNALLPNATNSELNRFFGSYDSDGFSFASGGHADNNASGGTYVAWGWDAGDGDPVSNTTGSINSTVKANPATGFSIVSYTGDGSASSTVGHGLSSSASMLIVKDRAVANNWRVWHKDLSANNWLYLNLSNAQASAATDGGIRNVDANTFGVY